MDKHSNHLVKNLKSYVQDSPDLLRIIQKENENGPQKKHTIPVTIDVCALYTSIPANGEDGGIVAFENALNQRSGEEQSKMPTEFLLECLKAVLNGNIFLFNEELYIQKIGTAMGTKLAPTCACLFMGQFEQEFLEQKWKGTKPRLFRRYIDDIFFLWDSDQEELELFMNKINSHNEYIKFTANYNCW